MQILRVVPYSATQLYSYEVLKKRFRNEKGELSITARLAAGGLAGMVATLVSCLYNRLHACHIACCRAPSAHAYMAYSTGHELSFLHAGLCVSPVPSAVHDLQLANQLKRCSCAHAACTT